MKKILMSLVAVLTLSVANGQGSDYKPGAGDVTAGFGFSGGLDNPSYGLRAGQIRGRYFQDDDMAYRAAVTLRVDSNTTDDDNSDSTTNVNLGFGIEKHFDGTSRLSPYYGGEVSVGFTSESRKQGGADIDVPSSFGFALAGVIGADYYFVENVYLGVEASLGIGYSSQEDASNFDIAPGTAGIKLGFVF